MLIAGNFLSGAFSGAGGNWGVCEDLAERLGAFGWAGGRDIARTGRVVRVIDIVLKAWSRANRFIQWTDIFWALALGWLLERLQKPYILTLHGNLPDFSGRWLRLTDWLLRRAAGVTAPSGYLADALHGFRHDIEILPNAIELETYPFRWRKGAHASLV